MLVYLETAWQRLLKDLINKPWHFLVILLIFLVLNLFFRLEVAFFLTVFFCWLLLAWQAKIIAFFALICLLTTPLFLILGLEEWANRVTLWFFYSISVITLLHLVDIAKVQWFLWRYKAKKRRVSREKTINTHPFKNINVQNPQQSNLNLRKEQNLNYSDTKTKNLDNFTSWTSTPSTHNYQNLYQTRQDGRTIKSLDLNRNKQTSISLSKDTDGQANRLTEREKKRLIFSYLICLFLCLSLAYLFFDFPRLFAFRDLMVVPDLYLINLHWRPLFFIDHLIRLQPLFATLGIPAHLFWSSLLKLIFALTNFLSFLAFLHFSQLQTVFFGKHLNRQTRLFLPFFWSVLYTYNPWTLERLLMGHINVLLGQIIFPLLVFLLYYFLQTCWNSQVKTQIKFPRLEKVESTPQKSQNFRQLFSVFAIFSLALVCLTFINVHQTFFIYYLFALSFLVILLIKTLTRPSLNNQQEKLDYYLTQAQDTNPWFNFFKKNIFPFFALCPSLLLVYGQYRLELTQYLDIQSQKLQIVRAFSLKVLNSQVPFPAYTQKQNFLERALIGSASWNTPTFVEVYDFQENNLLSLFEALGVWRSLTIYFNPALALLFITWLFSSVFLGLLLLHRNHRDWFWWTLLLALIASLSLNFGLSFGFGTLNRWFYQLPFSYVFREPGKFYGLFLTLACIIFAKYYHLWPRIFQYIHLIVLPIVILSNLLIFWPLKQVLNYVEYPSIFAQINQTCTLSDLILLLPQRSYWLPYYSSRIFTVQPSIYFRCPVLGAQTVTLADWRENGGEEGELPLKKDKADQKIDSIIANYLQEFDSWQNTQKFLAELKKMGITILVVEEFSQKDLQELNQRLSKYLDYRKEKTIYWYQLKTH